MSLRHQQEKAALLESREKWDQQVAGLKAIALITNQAKLKRIAEGNAAQNQAIQKQNLLRENWITSTLKPRIVQGPRKIRQGWSIFVPDASLKVAKALIGGKVIESV